MLSVKTVRLIRNHVSLFTINKSQLHSPTQEIKDAYRNAGQVYSKEEHLFALSNSRNEIISGSRGTQAR